jgi:hypothetical protein
MPSAKVLAESPTTRSGPFHDRYTASAFTAPTPTIFACAPSALRTVINPQAPEPPPSATKITSASGRSSNTSSA